MAKRFRKEHTMSFATTLPMKKHIENAAQKEGIRVSSFVVKALEEKIGTPPETREVETKTEQATTQE